MTTVQGTAVGQGDPTLTVAQNATRYQQLLQFPTIQAGYSAFAEIRYGDGDPNPGVPEISIGTAPWSNSAADYGWGPSDAMDQTVRVFFTATSAAGMMDWQVSGNAGQASVTHSKGLSGEITHITLVAGAFDACVEWSNVTVTFDNGPSIPAAVGPKGDYRNGGFGQAEEVVAAPMGAQAVTVAGNVRMLADPGRWLDWQDAYAQIFVHTSPLPNRWPNQKQAIGQASGGNGPAPA